jgi:hypothetical protein
MLDRATGYTDTAFGSMGLPGATVREKDLMELERARTGRLGGPGGGGELRRAPNLPCRIGSEACGFITKLRYTLTSIMSHASLSISQHTAGHFSDANT